MSGDELEKHLNYLQKKELRIVTAESATSGMAASILSDVPGSGAWLECGLTVGPTTAPACLCSSEPLLRLLSVARQTYSETSKVKILGIDEKVLRDNNLTSGSHSVSRFPISRNRCAQSPWQKRWWRVRCD
ncbi:hypothetical protein DFJ74DRAFT_467608 [Hyaloraphidium curvatum]|nr:hypothetical protein DFJ74DRAFT_467608 [Hyaloraphidium curvatum]